LRFKLPFQDLFIAIEEVEMYGVRKINMAMEAYGIGKDGDKIQLGDISYLQKRRARSWRLAPVHLMEVSAEDTATKCWLDGASHFF
jgi:hypothetical protein